MIPKAGRPKRLAFGVSGVHMMRRIMSAALIGAAMLLSAGCGGGGEKGKNKDRDVPKTAKGE